MILKWIHRNQQKKNFLKKVNAAFSATTLEAICEVLVANQEIFWNIKKNKYINLILLGKIKLIFFSGGGVI